MVQVEARAEESTKVVANRETVTNKKFMSAWDLQKISQLTKGNHENMPTENECGAMLIVDSFVLSLDSYNTEWKVPSSP